MGWDGTILTESGRGAKQESGGDKRRIEFAHAVNKMKRCR